MSECSIEGEERQPEKEQARHRAYPCLERGASEVQLTVTVTVMICGLFWITALPLPVAVIVMVAVYVPGVVNVVVSRLMAMVEPLPLSVPDAVPTMSHGLLLAAVHETGRAQLPDSLNVRFWLVGDAVPWETLKDIFDGTPCS